MPVTNHLKKIQSILRENTACSKIMYTLVLASQSRVSDNSSSLVYESFSLRMHVDLKAEFKTSGYQKTNLRILKVLKAFSAASQGRGTGVKPPQAEIRDFFFLKS